MKKITLLFILSFTLLTCALAPSAIHAQALTDSETEEASGSSSIESIKKIIKENLNSGLVQGAIENLINRKVAMIGEVSRVTDETITLTNRLGTRIIPVSDVLSITKDGKDLSVTDIAVENWILVLGKIKDDNFTPIFIEVSAKSFRPKNQFVTIGTVTDITATTITIDPRSSDSEKEIKLVKGTTFEGVDGEEINKSLLSEDITVLISGYIEDESMEAATVHSLAVIETDE
jgi:hypothetical protein